MGSRMVDEFFARLPASQTACNTFEQVITVLAKQAMKVFLNTTAEISRFDDTNKTCFLVFKDNPLGEYVILPVECQNKLWYSNILCGLIRGALE